MRVLSASLTFVAATCCLATACTNDAAVPAFAAINYQVRCLGECMESVDNPGRRISNIDGEEDLEITCERSQVGGKPVLSFEVRCQGGEDSACSDTPFAISVDQLNLDDGDKLTDAGDGCTVLVREGPNRYEGACTAGDPDPAEDRPCAITLERNGAFLEGTILCEDIPNQATKASTRYLTRPGSRNAATFKLEGCAGL